MTLSLTIDEDRRAQDRSPESGKARCAILSQRAPGRVAMIELHDTCPAGLGIVSPVPAEPGDTVQLFPFYAPIATVHADVVHCTELPDGAYAIGLRRKLQTRAAPKKALTARQTSI